MRTLRAAYAARVEADRPLRSLPLNSGRLVGGAVRRCAASAPEERLVGGAVRRCAASVPGA